VNVRGRKERKEKGGRRRREGTFSATIRSSTNGTGTPTTPLGCLLLALTSGGGRGGQDVRNLAFKS
jgi:hypothetical protein